MARLLGSPSTIATFDDERWYYVSQRREIRSFFQNDITNQDVVTIVFDDIGTVTEVAQLDLEQAVDVKPSTDQTRTLGNEIGIVEQLLGNIGRFGDPGQGGVRPGQAARRVACQPAGKQRARPLLRPGSFPLVP